ncbi:uncharacterized protein LOC131259642 [Anopheles coustani]|uniref:uncharacterized protein LOC131259642 n=1 Tax=Anopheles coustani TaxID=139045 RepID=UPI002658C927|nr:uncharacterized protein LOC131259642 [Anopheles coustani]
MSGGASVSRRIVIASAIGPLLWLATLSAAGTKSRPVSSADFVAIRTVPNRTVLCWAIKLSPTAYVADAACVRRYRRHQIAMIYGDGVPREPELGCLRGRLVSLRTPQCRHGVPSLALVTAPAGSNRSSLSETVRNFIAAYGIAQEPGTECRECEILAIRRVLPCRTVEPGTVVLYNDCRKQIEAIERAAMNRQTAELDGWTWQLRRTLQKTLYARLEQRGRQQLEWLKFITSPRR